MKKVIIESVNGNIFETERCEPTILSEADVKKHVKQSPKIDVNELLKQGYVEAKKFHHDLENGLL